MYYFLTALIIAVCLAFLILHHRLARRLQAVETAFAPLEDALRERTDLLTDWINAAEEPDEDKLALRELCETARDSDADEFMKVWKKIDRLVSKLDPEPPDGREPLIENERKIRQRGKQYNKALEPYNAMLDKFPWRLYASSLMIKKEEKFRSRMSGK